MNMISAKKGMMLTALTISFLIIFSSSVHSAPAKIENIFLVVKPDMGGPGYDMIWPGTIFVQQNYYVNISIRNTDDEGFQLSIQNYTSVTVQPGQSTPNGTVPVNTIVPMFNATKPGIFKISVSGHESMTSYLVVLPADWSTYNPKQASWNFTTLVIPDIAGDGYDKFFPSTFVVNAGDNVTFNIRNLDEMPHGFAISSFGINVAVNQGVELTNGTIRPVTTKVPTFTANIPGVYTFICTVYCGPGHIEMVGTLVVLPKEGIQYSPVAETRYGYTFIVPDFAGDGYDKFIPSNIVVNQGDLVYIKIRNTDEMKHGFTLTVFNINNETVKPAVEVNGTLEPTDTYITPFTADKPGVYMFFCSIYCGEGHNEMVGYLIVLPESSVQQVTVSQQGVNLPFMISGITGTLLVGIAIGMLLVRWRRVD